MCANFLGHLKKTYIPCSFEKIICNYHINITANTQFFQQFMEKLDITYAIPFSISQEIDTQISQRFQKNLKNLAIFNSVS